MKRPKASKAAEPATVEAFRGGNGLWGVRAEDGLIYDPTFSHPVALRIAQLENSAHPPKDWEETEEILRSEGFELTN